MICFGSKFLRSLNCGELHGELCYFEKFGFLGKNIKIRWTVVFGEENLEHVF